MKTFITKLTAGQSLTRTESYQMMEDFDQAPVEKQAALLALFACKKESGAELLGARDFLMEKSAPLNVTNEVIDIVGTGGDRWPGHLQCFHSS